jgi:hypothetical protein
LTRKKEQEARISTWKNGLERSVSTLRGCLYRYLAYLSL